MFLINKGVENIKKINKLKLRQFFGHRLFVAYAVPVILYMALHHNILKLIKKHSFT